MQRVSLLKCDNYDNETLKGLFLKSLQNIEFDFALLKGARVGLKPNLMIISAVERAIITHPEFLRVAAQLVR